MTSVSNIYANAVSSEHPISMYTLDDDVRYISLISENKRYFDLGEWSASVDNSASVSFDDSPSIPQLSSPFNSDVYTSISASNVTSNNTTIRIESPEIFSFDDLNEYLGTFAISLYLYQSSFFVNWYEVGYVYFDSFEDEDVEVLTRVESEEGTSWTNFDFSYVPTEYDSSNMRILIKINVDSGGGAEDYSFIVNGISVGQWSETFSSKSLGVYSEQTPLSYQGVPAMEYGIQEQPGYYIVEDNLLLAKNEGIPIVYGSETSTRILNSLIGSPSIVFPGRGFLHSSGKYSEYSAEIWINIHPNTHESRRIFGPIDNEDGIYVNNGFISLVLGNSFSSHPVSEWHRPMLIHLQLSSDTATMFINGEQVLSTPINRNQYSFPTSNDWLGFYSYEDIQSFSIDCFALYPYVVPTQVAKRRFVYGQGTDSPEVVADSFDGSTTYVNYSNANYNFNKIYPDLSNWEGGYSENLNKTKSSISTPQYELPQIYIGGRGIQELYNDNKIVNELEEDRFFTFRPNVENEAFVLDGTNWTEPGYILFDSLGIVDSLSSIYGVFSTTKLDQSSTLMKITSSESLDLFEISLIDGTVEYTFNDEVFYSEEIEVSETEGWEYELSFGINIRELVKNNGYQFARFFQSVNSLQAYFGGNGENTFEGKIYSIGLCNYSNTLEISDNFTEEGVVDISQSSDLKDRFATYTLVPLIKFNNYFLDISISSLWEEYFPLSIFAGYVNNYEGKKYYDIDFLQINLGYPSVYEVVEELRRRFGWKYVELFSDFNVPSQRNYSILNTPSLSSYETYEDLKIKNEIESFLDTQNSSLRSYITFQLLSEGANEPLSNFPFERKIVESRYIDTDLESDPENPVRPYLTKFEFVDKTVVFPPKYFDFSEVAVVFHFIIKHEGILSNPLIVRNFEIASRALDYNEFNAIGSEDGSPFYSYVKSGIYYENKTKNPILIAKNRNPYLYLTEDSGVSILGDQTLSKEYGIAIPVNQEGQAQYEVNAIQVWMRPDIREYSSFQYPIFEIQGLNKTIEFVIRSDASGKRGIVAARNKETRTLEDGIVFYQNGIRVKSPLVEFDQWSVLGISFESPISFSGSFGYINLFRGATFNNITNYRETGLGKTLEIEQRAWRRVLSQDDIENLKWSYWYVFDNTPTNTRTNIAFNPSFETNTTGWAANGSGTTIERISSDSRFGSFSLKCTTGTANNSGVLFANSSGSRMVISPSTQYTASAYVRVPNESPNKNLVFRVREYSLVSGGSVTATKQQQPVVISSSDGWSRIFYTFTSGATSNALGIEILQETLNQNGSIFYVDGVLVENSSSLSPQLNKYFDGSVAAGGQLFESLTWTGTENNSTSVGVYYDPSEDDVRRWVNVYAISEKNIFSLTPEDIYKAFIGINRFVVDDSSMVTFDADTLRVLSGANWSRYDGTPA